MARHFLAASGAEPTDRLLSLPLVADLVESSAHAALDIRLRRVVLPSNQNFDPNGPKFRPLASASLRSSLRWLIEVSREGVEGRRGLPVLAGVIGNVHKATGADQ